MHVCVPATQSVLCIIFGLIVSPLVALEALRLLTLLVILLIRNSNFVPNAINRFLCTGVHIYMRTCMHFCIQKSDRMKTLFSLQALLSEQYLREKLASHVFAFMLQDVQLYMCTDQPKKRS